MKNNYTKNIRLQDVADEKQIFKRSIRNDAATYKVIKKEGSGKSLMVVFTSLNRKGKSYRLPGKTNVFIKDK